MGKQYIFRPSSTTPHEVLDFLEEATKETSFPKLLVSLVEHEMERRSSQGQPPAPPLPGGDDGFDFSLESGAAEGQQDQILAKLDKIEQKVDNLAVLGTKVGEKVTSVDDHLFSSMKVLDSSLKSQAGMLKKIQQAKSLSAVAVEQSVFASMPERTIFSEMSEDDVQAGGGDGEAQFSDDQRMGTDELLKALLEA